VVPAKEARDGLFNALDVNGNGGLSLAEIDKGVVSGIFTKALSPEGSQNGESFDHKPALMRAYRAADRSQDGFIERSEFALLLQYMVYFNNLWHKFEAIDSDHDRRLDLGEFTAGCKMLGLEISAEEAEAEFMRCDADGGGLILFGEFCAWCAARHVGGMALSSERMQNDVVDTAIPPHNHNTATVDLEVSGIVDAIRDAITMRWKSLSNGSRGQDKLSKLFSVLDEDNSGALRLAEFSTAIRKAGQVRRRTQHAPPPSFLHELLPLFSCPLSSGLGLIVVSLLIGRPDHSADGVRR
jgi:Ca2+-binding EF-hand superfamily protein